MSDDMNADVKVSTNLNLLICSLSCRSHSFNVHTPFKKEKIQDPPVEHDLYVTLEEINTGCVKKMKISRRVMQPDGSSKKEDKYVSISVKPGWKSGTKVTFQKEGDQAKGKIPSDIVFIIRDKPHTLFRREGCDLRYTARLTLKQVRSIERVRGKCPFMDLDLRAMSERVHTRFTSHLAKKVQVAHTEF